MEWPRYSYLIIRLTEDSSENVDNVISKVMLKTARKVNFFNDCSEYIHSAQQSNVAL